MIEPLVHETAKYSKKDFIPEIEAQKAAKEFFQVADNTIISGAHSIQEGKKILLFDYL